jgi:lipopolysaccharide biosynthesis regulator YciM
VAEQLVRLDPDIVSWRALLAEIQLELGDYDAAARTLTVLEINREDLAVAPRLARWYEITGRTKDARQLLREARDAAMRRSDLPREQQAWFYLRTADHALRNGDRREAVREATRGLEVNPGDVRLIAVLARVAHAKEDWTKVAELVEPIIATADIATLSLLGDTYANLHGHALAENIYSLIEHRAAENPEPFNRQWTQFRLDHGRELEATVAILEREAAVRPDVLGLDQLAWGYHLLGRDVEAKAAVRRAMRMGTRDLVLQEHARLIATSSQD